MMVSYIAMITCVFFFFWGAWLHNCVIIAGMEKIHALPPLPEYRRTVTKKGGRTLDVGNTKPLGIAATIV